MKKLYTLVILTLVLSCICRQVQAQKKLITVSGTVMDRAKSTTLTGVTVFLQEKPIRILSTTDSKGKFTVKVPEGSDIYFRSIGFETQKQKVVEGKDMLINMEVKESQLKDIVVVGYNAKRKELATGTITTITAKDIQDVPASNVITLLQGKVAGLNIQNNNGTPGMVGTITLRGISNTNVIGSGNGAYLTPSSPLFVVDGIPVDQTTGAQYGFEQAGPGISPLSLIPTEDIAEIQVLKDAQATSLYGSKGAYGVILITTKRGRSAVPIVQYTSNYYMSTPPRLQNIIGGKGERWSRINQIMQFDTSYYHALNSVNTSPFLSDSLNAYYNNSTDWQKLFYATTFNQTQNVNISGGSQTFNYKVNTGVFDQTGIIENTGFSRYNLDMNMQYAPNDKFKLFASISSSLAKNSKGSGNSLLQTGIAGVVNSSSLLPPPSLFTASNAALAAVSISDDNKTASIATNLELQYQLAAGLRATTTFGYTYSSATEETFSPGLLNNNTNQVYAYSVIGTSMYSRSGISYTKVVARDHNFNIFAFNELSVGTSRGNTITQVGTPNDQIQGPRGYNSATSSGSAIVNPEARSLGYSAAFSYNYKTKYVLDLSYRLDGTSTSGTNTPWSRSPGAGFRWNFNKEAFLKNANWLDYGSIRVTWGRNIVPTGTIYDVYGKYTTDPSTYNNQPSTSLDLTTIPNQFLVPSSTTQWNYGLDLGFLNGAIGLSFDTYYKQTDFILSGKNIANINVFTSINTNETSLVNYGQELSLTFRPLSPGSKLKWNFSINGSYTHDVLAALPDNVRQIIISGGDTGQPIINRLGTNALANVLLNYKGVYSNTTDVPIDPLTGLRYRAGGTANNGRYFRAGDPSWTDLNGDYVLDANDFVIAGDSQPRFVGGFSNSMQYGPLSFSFNASYVFGRDILNNALASRFQNFSNPTAQNALAPIGNFNFWRKPGDVAIYPNPYDYTRSGLISPFQYGQTLFQEDGSYLKINSVTFSYNLNPKFTKRFGVTSCRVYGTVSNIYTFSFYNGPDPEVVSALGRDVAGGYPTSHDFTLGLSVQF
ncbi:MAG: hypothetical protein JWQ66_2354 [Mucilaginibacter sp.]|nr:hypothetical protein [Mucilaginibacter sp.]